MLQAALAGLGLLMTIPQLADMWDEGDLIGAPEWTKAGKRKKAVSAGLRYSAEDEMFGAADDLVEENLSGRLSEIAGMGRGMDSPSGYMQARDAQFMGQVSKRYRKELENASLPEGPSIMELAAQTGLV